MESSSDDIIENDDDYGEFSENSSTINSNFQNQSKKGFKINKDKIKAKQNINENNDNKYHNDNFYFSNKDEFRYSINDKLEQRIQKEFLKQKIEEMGRNSRTQKNYESYNYEEEKDFEGENNILKEQNDEAGENYGNENKNQNKKEQEKEVGKSEKDNIIKKDSEFEKYKKIIEKDKKLLNNEPSKIMLNRLQIQKNITFGEFSNSKTNNYITYKTDKTDNVEIYGNKKSRNNNNTENQNTNEIVTLNLQRNASSIYNDNYNENINKKLNKNSFEIDNIISENFSTKQLNDFQKESKNNNIKMDFNNLLKNKMFKKFLKNKINDYKNDSQIPTNFIDNLGIIDEKGIDKTEDKNDNIDNIDIIYNSYNYYGKNSNKNRKNKITISKTVENKNKNFNSSESYNKNFNDSIKFENVNNNENYKFEKEKNSLLIENKKLMNKILSLQNEIEYSKNELYDRDSKLKNYLNNYDLITNENKVNIEKIDELKKKLNNQKDEMQNKINKITELENLNSNLKIDLNKLQKNFDIETTCNKEIKQNYEEIKSNYNDIKNNYDLLNIKYKTLSDENYNYRRDKDLYEKQLKSKNEMIDNLLDNNSVFKKLHLNNELNRIKIKDNNYLDFLEKKSEIFQNKNNKITEINGMENDKNENEKKEIESLENDVKFEKMTFPELQSKRDELIQERKEITSIYSKIPLKTTRIEQINKREQFEKRLKEIGSDLAKIKLKLKNFNN